MSLKIYRQKRRLEKSKEPSGSKIKKIDNELIFVVQKHDASHLHFDLRLEKDGVLKSWAVPKGPSMNPDDKRLAIRVEDHPFEYAKFEGIIPEGNYGAGTVEIWDKGTYVPKFVDNKHWEFELKGKRLKGMFSLIKTKDKNWLLIKMKDKESVDDEMPHKIKPMLATLIDRPFDKEDWFFEIKWDGYRAITEVEKGGVKLYSRNLMSFENKFPSITEELKKIPHEVILDGEIVALDENGKPSFQNLQNYGKDPKGELVYYVFDILFLDGLDLQNKPLKERKKILAKIISKKSAVTLGEEIEKDGITFFEAIRKQGLEGIVAKDANSIYEQGVRGQKWLKIKTHLRQEAVICGFTEPRGGRENFGALILGIYEGDELKYIGHTGTGFSETTLRDLHVKLKQLEQKKSPFLASPKTNMPVTWVKPTMVCEIKFQEWTTDGLMRQPVFMGLRNDKSPKDVKRENFLEPKNQKKMKKKIKFF